MAHTHMERRLGRQRRASRADQPAPSTGVECAGHMEMFSSKSWMPWEKKFKRDKPPRERPKHQKWLHCLLDRDRQPWPDQVLLEAYRALARESVGPGGWGRGALNTQWGPRARAAAPPDLWFLGLDWGSSAPLYWLSFSRWAHQSVTINNILRWIP